MEVITVFQLNSHLMSFELQLNECAHIARLQLRKKGTWQRRLKWSVGIEAVPCRPKDLHLHVIFFYCLPPFAVEVKDSKVLEEIDNNILECYGDKYDIEMFSAEAVL